MKWNLRINFIIIPTLIIISSTSTYGQSGMDSLITAESEYQNRDTVKAKLILEILTQLGRSRPDYRRQKLEEVVALCEDIEYPSGLAQSYKHFQRHFLYQNAFDSSIYFANKSLEIARSIGDTVLYRNVLVNRSTAQRVTRDFEEAKNSFLEVLEIDIRRRDTRRIAEGHVNLGGIYNQLKQLDKSMETFLAGESYVEEAGDAEIYARYYLEFGHLYRALEDIEKTIEYYEKSKAVAEESDLKRRAFAANINLTNYLAFNVKGGDLDKAFESATSALTIARELRDIRGTARVYTTLGSIENRRGNNGEAMQYYEKAIPIFERIRDSDNLINALKSIADIHRFQGDYRQSIEVSERIIDLAKKRKDLQSLLYQTRVVALCYRDLKNYKQAFEYEKEGALLADSLNDVQNAVQVGRLESAVELAEKEKENAVLAANNELEAEKREKATFQRNVLIAIAMVVIVSALVISLLQRARQRAIKKLVRYEQDLNKMRTDVFMSIAHEIRTPLTLIYGPSKELARNPEGDSGRLQTIMKTVTHNCEKIIQRIQEIFDLSKLEMQDLAIDTSTVRLKPFVQSLFAAHQYAAGLKGITAELHYRLAEATLVRLDEAKVTKVVENLLSNAVKYTPREGQVSLEVLEDSNEGRIIFKVSDTGPGISQDDLSRVFERYFRSEEAIKIGGAGIGLALARELAQLMEGDIAAESELGKGSVFTFSIPFVMATLDEGERVDYETSVEPQETEADMTLVKPSANVLVVEDDLDMQEYLKNLLTPRYQVKVAGDGLEALELLSKGEWDFDLIISDIMMPRMDGFELLDRIKSNDQLSSLPIIMLTAKTGLEDRLKALRVGVDDYINKPFDSRELLYRVTHLINNKMSRGKAAEIDSQEEDQLPTYDQEWLAKVETIVKRELDNTEFGVGDLADEMASSTRQVQRKLSSLTGLTPVQYIRQVKLDAARTLLESGRYQTVSEVSYRVGFDTPYYFSTLFYKQYGKRPKDYIRLSQSA